MIKEIL